MGQNMMAGSAPSGRATLRKTLTLFQVVVIGLAYLQPMTLFDIFGIVLGLTDGHMATAYAGAVCRVVHRTHRAQLRQAGPSLFSQPARPIPMLYLCAKSH